MNQRFPDRKGGNLYLGLKIFRCQINGVNKKNIIFARSFLEVHVWAGGKEITYLNGVYLTLILSIQEFRNFLRV